MSKALITIGLVVALFVAATGAAEARAIDNVGVWSNWNDAVFVSNYSGYWILVTVRVTEYHRYNRNLTDYIKIWVAPYDSEFLGYTGQCSGDIYDVGYCITRARF